MKTKMIMLVAALVILPILAGTAVCDKPETGTIIAAGKAATALVEVGDKKSSGTAFCVDETGFFVTNAHVVKSLSKGGTVRLVLQPGEQAQQVLTAEVVMKDEDLDLALLKVKDQAKLTALKLGNSDTLVETQQIFAFGFPFGSALSFEESKFPAISVNMGHVTALRKKDGVLEAIQVDADLNPGNSGGPVLDENGDVIGVVQAGVMGTNVNFLIPVAKAKQFLSKVIVTCTLPELSADSLDKPAKFLTTVIDFQPVADKPIEVELTLEPSGKPKITQAMTGDGKQFSAEVAALLPKAEGPVSLGARVEFAGGGRMEGMLDPVAFKSGDEEITSDKVSVVTGGEKPQITLRAKGEKKDITPDTKLNLAVGPHKIVIDLASVKTVTISPPVGMPARVAYTVVARRGGEEVGRVEGTIPVAGGTFFGQAAAESSTINVTQFEGDKTIKKCPDVISDIIDAGSGKYLVCFFPKLRKIGIFDVEKLEFVKYISANDDTVKFAAGRDKLIVALCSNKVLQRWSLTTFEKEVTVAMPVSGTIVDMCMGAASDGPLYMATDGRIPESESNYCMIDVSTMHVMNVKMPGGDFHGGGMRASANGSLVGFSNGVLAYDGATARFYNTNDGYNGAFIPNASGTAVFAGTRVYTREMKRIREAQNETMIPGRQGDYYLGILMPGFNNNNRLADVRVYLGQDSRSLVSLGDLGLTQEFWQSHGDSVITLDKRIWCLPLSKVIIILGITNDQFTVYRFDPDAALAKSDVDYLFVASTPPATVAAGQNFTYKIDVKSKKGGVKFKLESGPDGMTLSETGELTWAVPADMSDAKVSVIICISDATGQEIYHNFELKVVQP